MNRNSSARVSLKYRLRKKKKEEKKRVEGLRFKVFVCKRLGFFERPGANKEEF